MAKKSLEEILNSVKAVIGDNDTDEALGLIEDITDSFTPETEDWKKKYEENDAQWRARYRDRFYNTPSDDKDEFEEEEKPKMKTFDDLFK